MSAPVYPLIRPAIQEDHHRFDEGLGLSALLELLPAAGYGQDDPATDIGVRVLVRDLSLRAAAWGAGPQGSFRAW